MLIGGLQKFSLIDYPGKICAIVFTKGCNFRCPYCHNPELVGVNQSLELLDSEEILIWLEERKGKIDAVSITGGEPTLQGKSLVSFAKRLKEMGFLVKIDTNGTYPCVLRELINTGVADYIAMDVKAPIKKYSGVVRSRVDNEKIIESIEIIKSCGMEYEFRTTIVDNLISETDLIAMAKLIKGAKLYVLQRFLPSKTLDSGFKKLKSPTVEMLSKYARYAENYVNRCIVR